MLQAKNYEFAQAHLNFHNPPIVIKLTTALGISSELFVAIDTVVLHP
jgi:DNA polymerase III delta prime subunit